MLHMDLSGLSPNQGTLRKSGNFQFHLQSEKIRGKRNIFLKTKENQESFYGFLLLHFRAATFTILNHTLS